MITKQEQKDKNLINVENYRLLVLVHRLKKKLNKDIHWSPTLPVYYAFSSLIILTTILFIMWMISILV